LGEVKRSRTKGVGEIERECGGRIKGGGEGREEGL